MPDLALADEVIQGAERFFHGRAGIGKMMLVQVDIVGAEARQAGLDGPGDVVRRPTTRGCATTTTQLGAKLGRHDGCMAPPTEGLAQHGLGAVHGAAIDVSHVEEVHPEVEGRAHDGIGGRLVAH